MGDWFDMRARMHFSEIRQKVYTYCAYKGRIELADDVLGMALLRAVERASEFDPRRSSFVTWVITIAKSQLMDLIDASRHVMAGGDRTHGVHLKGLHMVMETRQVLEDVVEQEDHLERGVVPITASWDGYLGSRMVRAVPFDDPFKDEMPSWLPSLWKNLTPQERACLKHMILIGSSYRVLGAVLGVSHTQAGKLVRSIRRKTEEAMSCTSVCTSLQVSSPEADCADLLGLL